MEFNHLEFIVAVATLLVAGAAVWVAYNNLGTIQKSADLAASQAVMDTYYRARDAVVEAAYRDMQDSKDLIEFEKRVPEGDPSRNAALKAMSNIYNLNKLWHKQALDDYATIVLQMSRLQERSLLGSAAESFLKEGVSEDVNRFKKDCEIKGEEVPEHMKDMCKKLESINLD